MKTRKRKTFHKLNCSPMIDNTTTVNVNSCYTPSLIYKLRDEFNLHHPTNKISTEDDKYSPSQIWEFLKEKNAECEKEDCWLDNIQNNELKKEICETVFSPYSPSSWKENPNEWLSNFDIENVMKQYEKRYKHFEFLGPSPIDFDTRIREQCVEKSLCNLSIKKMIKNKKTKIGIIFNLDRHDQSGSHWVSLFVDLVEHYIFYFDSTGEKIPPEINVLKERIVKESNEMGIVLEEHDNYGVDHQKGNTECGMYSLMFIITLLTGRSPFHRNKYLKNKNEKINIFKKRKISDKFVEKYRKIYFNYIK